MNEFSLRLRDDSFTFYADSSNNKEGDMICRCFSEKDKTVVTLHPVYRNDWGHITYKFWRNLTVKSDNLSEILKTIKEKINEYRKQTET